MAASEVVKIDNGLVEHLCPPDPLADIVAVHGFNSSPSGAWTHTNGKRWITDLDFLCNISQSARVFTFGYNANAFGNVIRARVVDHANNLLEELRVARRKDPSRPLIFVAHSLGGIVVKKALLEAKSRDDCSHIHANTSSIIFMGTPHNGADFTSLVKWLQRLEASLKWKQAASTDLTSELALFSQTLVDINRHFRPNNIETIDIYELKETRLPHWTRSALIVEPGSAILSGGRSFAFDTDHENLCKFDSPTCNRFKLFNSLAGIWR